MSKLVVAFPGIRYSIECPLLYFGMAAFKAKGYETYGIQYSRAILETKGLEEAKIVGTREALKQLEEIEWSRYSEIVFLEKSIGTAVAFEIETQLGLSVKHIVLTPVEQTLPYLTKDKKIQLIVSGTNDQYMEIERIKACCEKENLPLKVIEKVGHRLERKENPLESIEILKEITALY